MGQARLLTQMQEKTFLPTKNKEIFVIICYNNIVPLNFQLNKVFGEVAERPKAAVC